jgi:MFS family permease
MKKNKFTFHTQIVLLTLLRFLVNISIRMVYPFLSVFARAFQVNLTSISLALTVRSFAGVAAPILAPVADKYGSKSGMVFSAGLMSLALGLAYFCFTSILNLSLSAAYR